MTSHDPISPTDEALRWQLRALRQDMPPTRDLWPGIAARLATSPRHQAPVSPRRPWTPFAGRRPISFPDEAGSAA